MREALRGRRVLELWATERAAVTLVWLEEGPRVQIKRERELTEAAGSPDHQGVVAWCELYRYADAWELAGGPTPFVVCLDQVTDLGTISARSPARPPRRARAGSSCRRTGRSA